MNKTKIAIIGVGYVGINLAVRFPQFFETIAYDIDEEKINLLKEGVDPSNQFSKNDILECGCDFSSDVSALKDVDFYLITVPTPIDSNQQPNQDLVIKAIEGLRDYLNPGDTIVIESTVVPGTTNALKEYLGRDDVNFAFSPERISPSDNTVAFEDIVKVVACESSEKLEELVGIYNKIFKQVERSYDIIASEFAKLLENTSRDINIAMMNEFYLGAISKGIDFNEALRLARTKWNFPNVNKGLVGGHCISVDPHYLSKFLDNSSDSIILHSRRINDSMVESIVSRVISLTKNNDKILVLGLTYKKNCNDFRDSRAMQVYEELKNISDRVVEAYDPYLDHEKDKNSGFDFVLTLVAHNEFVEMTANDWLNLVNQNGAILDFAQVLRDELSSSIKVYY
ncbi:nucleotide sugar dehydrogenase [Halobacteriovorax sp. DA5]|uniref:nucleotide sugar dehydrogenase n=1 Tax=Halobacteriovorax sp. DA5 TaxID=2067553 RepID=UPI000CD16F05|nr:nucleotide sugar dehydrogenase [Halobacteriovorax sp. DA5]POB12768.1 hypothetical protein C0Z22_12865 [Halobacteriovorax sp. DA5]